MKNKRPTVDDIKEAIAEVGIDPSTVRVTKVKKGFAKWRQLRKLVTLVTSSSRL